MAKVEALKKGQQVRAPEQIGQVWLTVDSINPNYIVDGPSGKETKVFVNGKDADGRWTGFALPAGEEVQIRA
jgi:hypothetical protein